MHKKVEDTVLINRSRGASCFGILLVTTFALLCSGCGSAGGSSTPASPPAPTNNPVPSITSLSPNSAVVGSSGQTVTISGTGFLSSSTATYNGVGHTVTFVNSTELTIDLAASDLATAGPYAVVVTNPSPGGGNSNSVNFAVTPPPPAITSLSPDSAPAGSPGLTVTINGSNFASGATVTFNGNAGTVTFVSATQLTVALTAADLATAGQYPVVVINPDGTSSSPVNFSVTNPAPTPAPTVTSLSPASTFPCDPVPTLAINGTNFVQGSTVTFNGNPKTATFVSSTQLTIALTSGDIASPGSDAVVATNPAPGGGASTAVNFTVNSPTGPNLAGTAMLGATLKVYAVNPDGTSGALLCTSTTDSQTGAFSVTLDSATASAARLVASGGQVVYEGASNGQAANTDYTQTSDESALFDSILGGVTGIAIGMPSTFVDSLTQGDLAAGNSATEVAAHASATAVIDGFYGFSGTIKVELIGTSGSDGLKRELAEQGILTEGLQLAPNSPDDLVQALTSDISDGDWDGYASGKAVALGAGNLPVTAGTTDYIDSVVGWANGPGAVVLPAGATAPTPSLVQGLSACACTPAGVGLGPGNTGTTVSLAFDGHQYLFVGAGSNGVVAIDISDPTAKSPTTNVWSNVATTLAVNGLAAIVGSADHPQLFAFTASSNSTEVAVLNAKTLASGNPATDNPVEFSGSLTFQAGNAVLLSGGYYWITGAVWDGCWEGCRVEMATADGYTAFNPANDKLDESQLYPVQDSSETISENMGTDIPTGINVAGQTAGTDPILLAGNTGGIQLVDFRAEASFYMPYTTGQTYFPDFPAPIRAEFVDGSAVDPVYQVGVLVPEGTSYPFVGLMNLNGLTETIGSGGTLNSFTPPAGGTKELQLAQGTFEIEGAAIDRTTHLAAILPNSSTVAVGAIQNPASVPTGTPWSGFSDWVFYNASQSASLSVFEATNDPHGVTAIANLGAVNSATRNVGYAYMLDSAGTGVLQIDMNGFLALPRAGTTGDSAHQPASDPSMATDVTTGGAVMKILSW